MKPYIIAHDLGTTGNKATLYNQEGELVSSAFYGYDTEYAHPNWAEQDPEDWWQAVCTSTRCLLNQAGVPGDQISGIVFSGQMMACVPLDSHAKPLRKAIIWADQRATVQEKWVSERISADDVYQISGHRLSASYSLCKILWLRDNQPEIYRAAFRFTHAKDAIVARLTGNFVTDYSDASGMNLLDLSQGRWSERILSATGIEVNQLPEIHYSNEIVGYVRPEIADEAGVLAGTRVVIGGGDGPCAAAGAGVVAPGIAYNYIGSSSWIAVAASQPVLDPFLQTFTFCHIVPGMFTPTGTMQAAGASYQWLRNQLCQAEMQIAEKSGESVYELMNEEAEKSPAGAKGLIFLPYLMGERSPRWNPKARGGFIGLTIRHTRVDMIRAVLEGVTFNLRIILEAFLKQGLEVKSIRVIGGGARGRFWNQLMADIYGLPIDRLAILEEATSMGAALAGGVATGLYPDFSVAEKMNQVIETFYPRTQFHAVYNQLYPIYDEIYRSLEPAFEAIAGLNFV
jgi:xylulokinase